MSWISMTGIKSQVTAHRRLGNQAQVDLLLFQPGQGLGRGLALYGDLHVGILVNEGLKIGSRIYLHSVLLTPIRKWPMSNS